jgi:hypothetical protein
MCLFFFLVPDLIWGVVGPADLSSTHYTCRVQTTGLSEHPRCRSWRAERFRLSAAILYSYAVIGYRPVHPHHQSYLKSFLRLFHLASTQGYLGSSLRIPRVSVNSFLVDHDPRYHLTGFLVHTYILPRSPVEGSNNKEFCSLV